MRNDRKGFTLVELIVVMIIVGILIAVATAMMTANIARAQKTEAVVGLGAIRIAERMYRTEHGSYVDVSEAQWDAAGPLNQYLRSGDLNGRYYNEESYVVSDSGSNTFTVTATGTPGTVTMTANGNITGA